MTIYKIQRGSLISLTILNQGNVGLPKQWKCREHRFFFAVCWRNVRDDAPHVMNQVHVTSIALHGFLRLTTCTL